MYTVIDTSAVLSTTPAAAHRLRRLNDGVFQVMEMTTAESNPDVGLNTPNILL